MRFPSCVTAFWRRLRMSLPLISATAEQFAEGFTTPELKELESKILDAEDKMLALEREIFQKLRLFAAEHAARIRQTAAAIAELDVTCALAQVAAENRYTRPGFSDSGEIR